MGIVVIGGLMFSLVLTLYVVPALYSYLSTVKKAIVVPTKEDFEERQQSEIDEVLVK
jgi:multidrug efflux pump